MSILNSLPPHMTAIPPVGGALAAIGTETERLERFAEELPVELLPGSSVRYLSRWEEEFALSPQPGESIAQRQARCAAARTAHRTLTRAEAARLCVHAAGADRGYTEEEFPSFTVWVEWDAPPVGGIAAAQKLMEQRKPAHLTAHVRTAVSRTGSIQTRHGLTAGLLIEVR